MQTMALYMLPQTILRHFGHASTIQVPLNMQSWLVLLCPG